MLSAIRNEAGYIQDAPLGDAWSGSGQSGTAEMLRFVDHSNTDHATLRPNETRSGYVLGTSLPFWAFPRYATSRTQLATVSSGGVVAQFNQVMGGTLWTWSVGGFQFINTNDQGREIQSAFFVGTQNPTEAGDSNAGSLNAQDQQGSPTTVFGQMSPTLFSSRAIPLEFNQTRFGATTDQAIAYIGMSLGHDVQLNYNNLGTVAKYTTWLTLPSSQSGASLEMPTGYFVPAMSTYFTYDAVANSLTQVTPPNACVTGTPYRYPPAGQAFSGYGGVIVSNPAQTEAIGEYGIATSVGGPITNFTLWNFLSCGDPTSKTDAVATGSFPAGTTSYNSFIVSGTLSYVKQTMHQLYQSGAR